MPSPLFSPTLSRRSFLVASTVGFAGLGFSRPPAHAASPLAGPIPSANTILPTSGRKAAKSTILFFLCGGASHIDLWDLKPNAPMEYRGEFSGIRTRSPEIHLCEHLPRLAQQAHRFSLVHGITDYGRATGDHHAGYYYNLTGHAPDDTFRQQGNDRRPQPTDWPHMGCVIGMRRSPHPRLPNVITLPHKPSKLPYIRPGQFAGRIGMEYDPFFLNGSFEEPLKFTAPALTLNAGVDVRRIDDRRALLRAIDTARQTLDHDAAVKNYSRQQQKAFGLLSSSAAGDAFDIGQEPETILDRYGRSINGSSLLMARRLVEAGVPFITVFWKENESLADRCKSAGEWDTHGSNFECLRRYLLPEFDQAFSALLEDLSERGLLEQTLVLVTSEMGRKPQIGDPRSGGTSGAGRDHWTSCMSVLLAGGGIQGGRVLGASDARAEYPANTAYGPEDITRTVYHSMGIDNLEAIDSQGRPYNLLDEGRPLLSLFS